MPPPWYRWDGNDLLLNVHVQPGASQDSIDGTHGERLKIRISAPPVDGRANRYLLKFLARSFGVATREVLLEAGSGTRYKRIRIRQPQQLLPDIGPAVS